VGCIRGIAEACQALDFPVVSGNVSLYNETQGRAILPTPTIGAVGLLDDFSRSATIDFKAEDETILLIGGAPGWLGQSLYLRDICGREEGAPPPVDLAAERRHGDFVRAAIRAGTVTAVHDVSDGGLLIALAEMAIASGRGARLDVHPKGAAAHGFWFGEDQARYVVTARQDDADKLMCEAAGADVAILRLGATGGDALLIAGEPAVPVARLTQRFEAWFPAYMAGQVEI
jgi:phosphoribosylformylglycinamidine (FGAM) synthase-like enzyme